MVETDMVSWHFQKFILITIKYLSPIVKHLWQKKELILKLCEEKMTRMNQMK